MGSTPGVTTAAQLVSIDRRVKLMDCPGIVFARARTAEEEADVLLRNCVKVEKMSDLTVPIDALLRRVPMAQLQAHFQLARFADVTEFLTLVALKRGKLGKGGAADHDAAARAVLQEWNAGALPYHSEPPRREAGEAVSLVPQLADEFDWNAAPPRVERGDESDDGDDSDGGDGPLDGAGDASMGLRTTGAFAAAGASRGTGADTSAAAPPSASIFGALQTLPERARGQRAPKRAKKESRPRKRPEAADDEAVINPRLNRTIRKQQQKDGKKKRRAASRMLAPFVEGQMQH